MTTKTMEVHKCDFCKKNYLSKSACGKHENICGRNPINKHLCFGCKHLILEEDIGYIDGATGAVLIKVKNLRCTELNKQLHTRKMAEKGLLERYSEQYIESELMPDGCESYRLRGMQL